MFLTQQVSLIGFEDMMHVNLTSPSFTYVSSASEETGHQAAGLIVRLIREPGLFAFVVGALRLPTLHVLRLLLRWVRFAYPPYNGCRIVS